MDAGFVLLTKLNCKEKIVTKWKLNELSHLAILYRDLEIRHPYSLETISHYLQEHSTDYIISYVQLNKQSKIPL